MEKKNRQKVRQNGAEIESEIERREREQIESEIEWRKRIDRK